MTGINIKTTNTELTDALRNYVEEKISTLNRHAGKDPLNIDVELEHKTAHHSGPIFRCEIMFEMPGDKKLFRAESTQEDMYAAIDTCIPKIKEQLDKERDKKQTLEKKRGRKLKEMLRKFWS